MMNYKILFLPLFLILVNCGAILDEYRMTGVWTLSDAEFYEYNSELYSTKVYKGIDKRIASYTNPLISEFFSDQSNDLDYSIEFNSSFEFSITTNGDDTDDFTLDFERGSWAIDSYDNSLIMKILPNDTAKGFWKDRFVIKNAWPMSNYQTLEITIDAADVGKSYFSVKLKNKTIKVDSMKGIFKRE